MGSGIAQVAAQAGLAVHLTDVNEGALQKGVETIKKNLARSVEKEHMSRDDMEETMRRIEAGTEYAADADLAIEAGGGGSGGEGEGVRGLGEGAGGGGNPGT